ncbi:uncharacterized protein DCS_04043 [Drechmeria coniospora]|uniref:SET domain protein n=1 Tax=Drechmeria coniospora TaxID=98403 RepID=A0A151GIX0_DRECN|nr:uncharacterized protein DCS_04043 [Drechmeria coniospora]KYK57036.1 uncharacterized protein DCS_04043 [Drechmeria coniospora]
MSLFAESLCLSATDSSSNFAFSSSTPPTTVADTASLHSDSSKHDVITVADDAADAPPALPRVDDDEATLLSAAAPRPVSSSSRRSSRRRVSTPVYNIPRLSGTEGHGKRRAKGDEVSDRKRRRTISGDTLVGSIEVASRTPPTAPNEDSALKAGIDALNLAWSPERLSMPPRTRRQTTKDGPNEGVPSGSRPAISSFASLGAKLSSMGSKGRKAVDSGVAKMTRELRRLQDTNEFTGIDDRPVIHTVWSNGKFVDPNNPPPPPPPPPPRKKTKAEAAADENTAKAAASTKAAPSTKATPSKATLSKTTPSKATPKTSSKAASKSATKPTPKSATKSTTKPAAPVSEPEAERQASEPITNIRTRRVKSYLVKGLYAGQDTPRDVTKGLTVAEKKNLAQLAELAPGPCTNKTMPLPIYTGLRTLIAGRDFKLPYQVCNPMPPGQPKPDEWKKMTRNRFIGDSKEYWRKLPHLHDYQSKCVCTPDDGCGESCQNRIMLYECDSTNCNVGSLHCHNRAFADLAARRSKGGKYRIGVEVIKTSDRGHGVRSNRCFKPNQIIMEYTGEIITEVECERRMNEVYKDNECYYLMSFDQNMIIDATTGSIARFVNHSCNPNCRMIKWIVSGQPRMALFAGDRPIMTGDELTYDYNFDPFSSKNVQRCLCGEPNCRGVLGPKTREPKAPKADLKNVVKATVKAGKRKLKELLGDEDTAAAKAKKRKIQPATGVKRSISSAGVKAAKGAATAIKKGMTTITVGAKKAGLGSQAKAGAGKKGAKKVLAKYGRSGRKQVRIPSQASSRASSLTIVAKGDERTKAKAKVMVKAKPVAKPKVKVLAKAKTKPSADNDSLVSASTPPKAPIARIRIVSKGE